MRLKLTLRRASGSVDDIVVTTDAAATISDIASTIARVDPQTPPTGREGVAFTMSASLPGHDEALVLPPDAPVGEAWIGSGATISVTESGVFFAPVATRTGPTLATLRVLSGPDAGASFDLKAGSTILGRDPGCDIVLTDALVSKRHVRFETDDGVDVIDLGSANGVVVDGGIVARLHVEGREVVVVGDSEIEITLAAAVAETGVAPKAGPIFFNRSPKVEPRYLGNELVGPEVPQEQDPQSFPFLALIAPLIAGGALFAFTHNAQSLLFVALSPLLMIGNFMTQRSARRSKEKTAIAKFEARLETVRAELVTERLAEHAARLREAPSTAEVLDQSIRRGPLLWTRRPEHWSFLNVRLGLGTMTSRNTIRDDRKGNSLPDFQRRFDELVAENRTVADVPLVDNLFDSGALGIAGSPTAAVGAANAFLVQLTGLHSPAELVVAALIGPSLSRGFEWLKWIPHTSSPHSPVAGSHLADSAASAAGLLSAIEGVVASRLESGKVAAQRRGAITEEQTALERGASVGGDDNAAGTESPVPAMVLLISDDVAIDRARLVQLAEAAADAGVYPIWISREIQIG